MIISKTPLRISFFGGGTDYPIWYNEKGGTVISSTIDKYNYITVRHLSNFFDYNYRVRYFRTEVTQSINDIKHPVVRECALFLGIDKHFELVHTSDIPARSGLGSSSSFSVGVLHAFNYFKNVFPTKQELAANAIHIEQNIIKESVGSQDQVAAAFGGFNKISFSGGNNFQVEPLNLKNEIRSELQNNLLLCFTGFARTASEIAVNQIRDTPKRIKELNDMESLTKEALALLNGGSLNEFGKLLSIQWKIKKSLNSKISNPEIDQIYESGLKNGALGGKLLGAGGGGFIVFYAPRHSHNRIKKALNDKLFIPFNFEDRGTQIIYNEER